MGNFQFGYLLVNGEGQILTPTESKALNRSTKNLAHVTDYVRETTTPYAKFGANPSTGTSGQIGEIYRGGKDGF